MNIKLLINSAKNYHKGIEKLLNSYNDAAQKWDSGRILVVQAGHRCYERKKINGIDHLFADNNSFDFTALIAVVENSIEAEGFMYIHDTCLLGPNFFIKADEKGFNSEMIPLKPGASMNIGYYSKECLHKHRDLIMSFKNKNYSKEALQSAKSQAIIYEDVISKNYKALNVYQSHEPHRSRPIDYYGTGTERIVEYYSGLDLYKIKSNWGEKPELVMVE